MQDQGPSGTGTVRGAIWIFLSLAGVAAAMTCLFLGMRAVMDIGGACAEGGPFVPRQPCPDGVPLMIVGGIWLGIALAGVYAWQVIRHGVRPNLLALLWPALFLSLGWNFLEYGVDPPFGEELAWGWLICGVVFFIMGGVPLLALARSWMRGGDVSPQPMPTRIRDVAVPLGAREMASRLHRTDRGSDVGNAMMSDPDVVSRLERLDALRRAGAIDDAEFEAAKAQVLGEGS